MRMRIEARNIDRRARDFIILAQARGNLRLQTESDRLLASVAEKDRELEAFRRHEMETRRRNQMLRGLVGQMVELLNED